MSVDEIVSPTGYALWWLIAGVIVIAAIVIGWVILFLRTRPDARDDRVAQAPAADNAARWDAARAAARSKIDDIEANWRDGSISERLAHQELAAVLRTFASIRTQTPAASLTLSELRTRPQLRPAADLIDGLYGPEFAVSEQLSVAAAAARARELVATW
ncbi:hypothetical protein [Rarobacter incanus]|uniref:Uncharacterized protein n=1 Tax=Rarobacter incanus TaxID=153494 RepID=A0A542SQB8_9MICO|nr:hypothetical protein [Rarobacter incanus]TQK76778.1 hypothetical protein FB389_1468 [Rarobacter incanus]